MTAKRIVSSEDNKKIVMEGLLSLTSICDQHNLRYYLAFGTLLGAARHKGFIPWDDDIDLMMPRKDYEKLRSLADEIKSDDWELLSYSNEPDFIMPFMKYCHRKTMVTPSRFSNGFIYGLSVDIFFLDTCRGKDEESVRKKVFDKKYALYKQEQRCFKVGVFGSGAKNAIKRVVKNTLFRLSSKKVRELREQYARLDRMFEAESQKGGEYAVFVYNRYDTVWKIRDFAGDGDQFSTLTFEGREFTVPYDYDAVLTKTYGDYMTPPPKEKQIPVHTYVAYYKD